MTGRSIEIEFKNVAYITSGSGDCPGATRYFLLHYLIRKEDNILPFVSRIGKNGWDSETLFSRLKYQIKI